MAENLTEVAQFQTNVTVPQDGDARNAASVRTPFQQLADRAQMLKSAVTGQLIGGDRIHCPGDDKIYWSQIIACAIGDKVYSLAAGNITPTLAGNTWYYVYAHVSGGVLAVMASTTAPDAALVWKSDGVGTHRYLGCFRTNATPKILPFRMTRGRYLYRPSPTGFGRTSFRALNLGTATAYAAVSLASWLPPHARLAELLVELRTSVVGSVSATLATTGDDAALESVIVSQDNASNASAPESRTVCLEADATQQVSYKVNAATTSLTAFVLGWWE